MTRAEVIEAARAWLGTPYRHQASRRGVGADCLGLIRGVWRDTIGPEPELMPPYSPDWAEVLACETLLDAARRHLHELPIGHAGQGDVLLFQMGLGHPEKHCETRLVPWWKRRIAAAFAFPGITLTRDAQGCE